MERIVVGMDGSEGARSALVWAAEIARATGAAVIAVNAHMPGQSEMRPGYLERLRDQRASELERWCGDLLDGLKSSLEVVDGDPRDVLPAALEQHRADLLVVASAGHRSKGPGFLHVGSVVEYLAHHLEHPMAVITPGSEPPIRTIVIGIDGSDHGRSAIGWTALLAGATGARVVALSVCEPDHPIASPGCDEDWQRAVERLLSQKWAAPLAALGDRFSVVVSESSAVADTLVGAAADNEADLVVVGARGLGGVTGLRIGGTALAVLHRAERPVVLVPRDPRDR